MWFERGCLFGAVTSRKHLAPFGASSLFLLLDPSAPFGEKNHALAIAVHFLEGSLGVGHVGKTNKSVGLDLVEGALPFVDGDAAVIFGVGVATGFFKQSTLLAINQGEGVEHQGVDAQVRVQEAELALVDVVICGGLDALDFRVVELRVEREGREGGREEVK